jgi:hypothetical protein
MEELGIMKSGTTDFTNSMATLVGVSASESVNTAQDFMMDVIYKSQLHMKYQHQSQGMILTRKKI